MADYYDLLGTARDADPDTLKRAYRRMARQYHPDVNKDPGAEDKFKEIGRAYEVLSDPQTRARYDQFGEAGLGGGGAPDMGVVPVKAMTCASTSPSTSKRRCLVSRRRCRFAISKPAAPARGPGPRRAVDPQAAAPVAAPARCVGRPAPHSAVLPRWRLVLPVRAAAR